MMDQEQSGEDGPSLLPPQPGLLDAAPGRCENSRAVSLSSIKWEAPRKRPPDNQASQGPLGAHRQRWATSSSGGGQDLLSELLPVLCEFLPS